MCGRYVFVKHVEKIAITHNLEVPKHIFGYKNFNVSATQTSPIQCNDNRNTLVLSQFGYRPNYDTNRLHLNARAEGRKNQNNDVNYTGSLGILFMPTFKHAIRNQRCVVWVNGFYEGPQREKLSIPYFVYHRSKGYMPLAGIWNDYKDKDSGEITRTHAIITVPPNDVCQAIGHHRSPVILTSVERWLRGGTSIESIQYQLKPYYNNQLQAYRVDPMMKKVTNNTIACVKPIGPRIMPEYKQVEKQKIKTLEEIGREEYFKKIRNEQEKWKKSHNK